MGKAEAAVAMVAKAPCQARAARDVAAARRAVWVAAMWR